MSSNSAMVLTRASRHREYTLEQRTRHRQRSKKPETARKPAVDSKSAAPPTVEVGYRALEPGQIRVVTLERGTPRRPIKRYRLHTVGLVPSAPEYGSIQESLADTKRFLYCALSYTWGDSHVKVPLKITDGDSNKTFTIKVTVSTIKALEQSSHHWTHDSVDVWADQICINQTSDIERSSQVSMMRDIYKCAATVFSWLGDPTHDSELAFRALKDYHACLPERWGTISATYGVVQGIGQESCVHPALSSVSAMNESSCALRRTDIALSEVSNQNASAVTVVSSALTKQPLARTMSALDSLAESLVRTVAMDVPQRWQAVAALLQRSYFTRAWVRQEVTAVSLDDVVLYSGPSRVNWLDVRTFLAVIYRSDAEHAALGRSAYRLCEFGIYRDNGATLLHLLEEIKFTEASDPRDKLYSVVGCAGDVLSTDSLLRPDYSQTTEEVFLGFVIWYITRYRNLDFLGSAIPVTNDKTRWVPQWDDNGHDAEPFVKSFRLHNHLKAPLYSACGPWLNSLRILSVSVSLPTSLALDGVHLVRIGWVSEASNLLRKEIAVERQWLHDLDNVQCPLNRIPMHEVFAHTVTADAELDQVSDGRHLLRNAAVNIETNHNPVRLNQLMLTTSGRSLFKTEMIAKIDEPLLGLGPSCMIPGDEIFMFKGGQVLYVIREETVVNPRSSTTLDCTGCESVTLDLEVGDVIRTCIGECFMYGLMDGEILDMIGPERKRQRPAALAGMDEDFKKYYLF